MPTSLRRVLVKLGSDVALARRKRRLSVADVTEAAEISAGTLRRLERGEPSVSIGALAMVLLALGEHRRMGTLIDMAADDTGLLLDATRLPTRIRRSRGHGAAL